MAGSRVRDASPALRAAGKLCIEVAPTSKMAWISEELCIGCGICVKVCVACCWPFGDSVDRFRSSRAQKCPFEAIMIINLPKNLEAHTTHRYGANTFKLHRFPFSTRFHYIGNVHFAGCDGRVEPPRHTRSLSRARRCVCTKDLRPLHVRSSSGIARSFAEAGVSAGCLLHALGKSSGLSAQTASASRLRSRCAIELSSSGTIMPSYSRRDEHVLCTSFFYPSWPTRTRTWAVCIFECSCMMRITANKPVLLTGACREAEAEPRQV